MITSKLFGQTGLSSFFTDPPPWMLVILWVCFGLMLAYLLVKLALSSKVVVAAIVGRTQGVPVTFLDLLGMSFRGVDPTQVVQAWAMAQGGGFEVSPAAFEAHALSGGDVVRVVRAITLARKQGRSLTWEEACEAQLAGNEIAATQEEQGFRRNGDFGL